MSIFTVVPTFKSETDYIYPFDEETANRILDNISEDAEIPGSNSLLDDLYIHAMFNYHEAGIFVIPAWRWVKQFVSLLDKNDKVIDFGAGACIITAMLRRLGIYADAVDSGEWKIRPVIQDCHIEDGIKFIKNHKDDYTVLFGGWPTYQSPAFKKACDEFLKSNPLNKKVFYIGEDNSGCTADETFFDNYETKCIKEVQYMTFFGLHDCFCQVIPRKKRKLQGI